MTDSGSDMKSKSLVSAVLFAQAVIEAAWSGEMEPAVAADIQQTAKDLGLLIERKPTDGEICDPEWWGHNSDIGPDDDIICYEPAFAEVLDAFSDVISTETEKQKEMVQ